MQCSIVFLSSRFICEMLAAIRGAATLFVEFRVVVITFRDQRFCLLQ